MFSFILPYSPLVICPPHIYFGHARSNKDVVVAASPATHYLQRAHGDNNDTKEPHASGAEGSAAWRGHPSGGANQEPSVGVFQICLFIWRLEMLFFSLKHLPLLLILNQVEAWNDIYMHFVLKMPKRNVYNYPKLILLFYT